MQDHQKHTVFVSGVVPAPIDQVWSLLRDFNALSQWHPGIAASRLEDEGRGDALGSVRYLDLQGGGFVRERLLALDDPAFTLRYSIIETSLPMRNYVAGVRLAPITLDPSTLFTWWADFTVADGADLAGVAQAVGDNVFAAGIRAIGEHLR
ncbi:SRPBCC family protein [Pseudomonadota bacterium AL_CKDN230030165-1A_HGKHYDSX7]